MTPLDWASNLRGSVPLQLGFGFEVRDMSADVANLDLDVWKRFVSDEERERVKGWSVCLVNSYREFIRGDREKLVETLMHYVVAHLRIIVPNRTNADRFLRADVTAQGLEPLSISAHTESMYLEDCEQMCAELCVGHLQKLRSWMPWIVRFRRRWRTFYPLFLSLYFAEMARREDDPRVRHMLRVMALEALVSTDKTYGFNALRPKLPKLLGPQTDIYAQYRNIDQPSLPPLILSNVLRDVCALRNKVAHGDAIPDRWLTRNCRHTIDFGQQLNYCEELLEASTGMLSLAWQAIIDGRLQAHFGTKDKMEAHFNSNHIGSPT
jgi:hypothetical protein